MPPSQSRSNIRAYVQWRNSSVFSGEELECIITFKNIASLTEDTQSSSSTGYNTGPQRDARYPPSIGQSVSSTTAPTRPSHTRQSSVASVQYAPSRGHRPALSLNLGRSTSRGGFNGTSSREGAPILSPGKGHARSLSIMSLGTESLNERRPPTTIAAVRRPSRGGHTRSASLQVGTQSPLQATLSTSTLPTRRHSPLHEATTPPALAEGKDEQLPVRPIKRRPGTASAGNTPQLRQSSFPAPHAEPVPDFEFPSRKASLASAAPPPEQARPKPTRTPSTMHSGQARAYSPRPMESYASSGSTANSLARVLSESSHSGTPRSSADFYSLSNRSNETLTSEVPSQAVLENGALVNDVRQSRRPPMLGPARSETLMMGYARPTGSFTLDGSLVNNAPFDDVKRKTVQGDGGVVGIEKPKRSSGVFGAFGWGGLGESIGGLLGSNDLSTMAQMKASAGTKSIPLLSTPQSLLFVDMTLGPGESKSYSYKFPLPKGLPPSHKGRAIKVEYTLAIGIQRPDGQKVKYVDVPFRVLGSVGIRGDALGHDLSSPYVLLQDTGRSKIVDSMSTALARPPIFPSISYNNEKKEPKKGLESFLRYTERLLASPQDSNGALLSPTEPLSPTISRKSSIFEAAPANTKEAIDLALLNANVVLQSGRDSPTEAQSNNRYTIARSGQPVAVLTLLRPAYRLGESIIGSIDFTTHPASADGHIPAYAVHIELQSSEQVDALLALRSEASIQRATKRVHASTRENTLFSRRLGFSLVVPSTATPSFETSGVSLSWHLKIEFTTFRPLRGPGAPDTDQGGDQLLEELDRDERGISLIAKERLAAETFEISVPVRVYGAFSIAGDADRARDPLEV